MSDKKKVEAVLFSIGREVSLERIAELCGLEQDVVKGILEGLQKEYSESDNSLSLMNRGENWKLTVKDEFLPLVSGLVEGMDLDKAIMETLAVIAWKYPVTQSEIIKLRHNKAYEHIKRLLEMEFVEKERTGRTYKLKLTKKFFEYFDLPSEEAKKAFLKNVPEELLKEAEEVDKAADEVEMLVEAEKKAKATKEEISKAMTEVKQKETVSEEEAVQDKEGDDDEGTEEVQSNGGDGDDDDDEDDEGSEEESISEKKEEK